MSGHETPEEKKYIKELERRINPENSSLEELLELSILYIEPSHREDEAITLLKTVLKRDPENEKAKILYSYCCLHYLMDKDSLIYAEKLLNEVIDGNGNNKGAAYNLLPGVLLDIGRVSKKEKINYFALSVKCEPKWVNNHFSLAFTYRQAGRLEEAIEELKIALENLVSPDPSWSLADEYYESFITGRNGGDSLIKSYLEKSKSELEKKEKKIISKMLKFFKSMFKKN
jgi:tetratricopeptide (TPR) repeat protein